MSDSNLERADGDIQPQSVLLTLTEGSFVADETVSEDVDIIVKSDDSTKPQHTESELTKRTEDAIQETLSEKLDKISIHEDEEEPSYVTPVADPYARAIRYMEHHNIMQIFQVSFCFLKTSF